MAVALGLIILNPDGFMLPDNQDQSPDNDPKRESLAWGKREEFFGGEFIRRRLRKSNICVQQQ